MELLSAILSLPLLVTLPVFLISSWSLWYSWKFIVRPQLYPNEPPELPYLIPVIGHVWHFFVDSHGLFSKGREYFGNTREPFCITFMGQSNIIITSAADVSQIYKEHKALDLNEFYKEILLTFGLNKDTLYKMFTPMYGDKCFMDISHDTFKTQMYPGAKMDVVMDKMLSRLEVLMRWEHIQGRIVQSESPDGKLISLYKWAQEGIVDSTTRAFWDDSLFKIAPKMLDSFWDFEEEQWKLPFQFPRWSAPRLYETKEYMEAGVTKYLVQDEENRPEESWMIGNLDGDMKTMQISPDQRGGALFGQFRTANANAYKVAFWLISHVLYDPPTRKALEEEFDKAYESAGNLDMEYLFDAEKCPLIESLYNETLRVYVCPMGVRTVVKPVVIGGKLLPPGKKLFMAYRQLHYDPALWGDDVETFNHRRFLENPGLAKSTSFRPFGGAATYCPGRFLARREVILFVATALHRYDMHLVGPDGKEPQFPKADDGLPQGGAYNPLIGQDVFVRIKPAQKK